MKGRRGISPLIATILLIAFAVALGSLVYSYIVLFQGGTGSRGCSSVVGIDSAIKVDDKLAYAIESGEIVIDIRNTGYTEVTSLTITYVGTEGNIEVPTTTFGIGIGRVQKFRQEYDRLALGAIQTIFVTPTYVRSEEQTICNEATIEITELRR